MGSGAAGGGCSHLVSTKASGRHGFIPCHSNPGNPFAGRRNGGAFQGWRRAGGVPVPRPLCPLQDDKEYVGFATLPNQVHRKSVKKGFDFTLMVAGTGAQPARGC